MPRSVITSIRTGAFWRNFFNLLDRYDHDIDYAYTSRVTPTAAAAFTDVFHPVEPFEARIGLEFRFGNK